jgi:predicted alpha/beta-hydrolase family hydrolase
MNQMTIINKELDLEIQIADQAKAVVILAHGAGANKDHHFMVNMSQLLLAKDISVIKFNFPYMLKTLQDNKRRPPDRMPKLTQHYLDVLASISTSLPLYIAGKSMGGRVAATIAEHTLAQNIKGVICLGYPFHPQKKPENLRLAPLQQSKLPVLICQGDRDALGSKEEVIRYQLPEHCLCVFFTDGDHDLKPRVRSGYTQQQHMNNTAMSISEFIDTHND